MGRKEPRKNYNKTKFSQSKEIPEFKNNDVCIRTYFISVWLCKNSNFATLPLKCFQEYCFNSKPVEKEIKR